MPPPPPLPAPPASAPGSRRLGRTALTVGWWLVLALGVSLLAAGVAERGPDWLGRLGSVAVTASFAWSLAVRIGSRPVVCTGFASIVGLLVVLLDIDLLRTGAAVMTAALAAVMAVMVTVPARRFVYAVREVVVATVTAAAGTLAAVGWDPVVDFTRFQYAVMALSLVGGFSLVQRLGSGLHGLGRRGTLVVLSGGAMLVAMLCYAELIRRYGTPGLVQAANDSLDWMRAHLNGYPRPIQALLGIPALIWGTHMRARRALGWWVCAFGVALTAPVACTLVNPALSVDFALLSLGYSLIVGVVIGAVLIRIEVAFTGRAGSNAGGKRAAGRRAAPVRKPGTRTEPSRSRALL